MMDGLLYGLAFGENIVAISEGAHLSVAGSNIAENLAINLSCLGQHLSMKMPLHSCVSRKFH